MPLYLGIDTSNYTTSVAIYDNETGVILQQKKLLPVAQGAIGLRQSDAVFGHVKQLGPLLEQALEQAGKPVAAVGVSLTPTDEAGSYMPCFLTGDLAAQSVASALGVPKFGFSHQAGHIAAALYSTGKLELLHSPFLAFHISGGTTQLLHVQPHREYIFHITTIASSLDLHAGQAVDRVGALLGLSFPAGPQLEQLALLSDKTYKPKPAFKGMDCCLSGLENQCAKLLDAGESKPDVAKYCISYLEQTILTMTKLARQQHPELPIVYAGGVMSNTILRSSIERDFGGYFAAPAFSADNAAGTAVLCTVRAGAALLEEARG